MAALPIIVHSLKAITALWALILLGVTAALQAKLNRDFGAGQIAETNFTSANAILAACALTLVYFGAVLALQLLSPSTILLSVMVDTIVLGCLFVLSLGAVAGESSVTDWFRFYDEYDEGKLGQAVIGLGWVFVFLLLGILLFEVIYTLKHYGRAYSTWRTPFVELHAYGARAPSGPRTEAGLGASAQGDVPAPVPMGSVRSQQYATSQPLPASTGTGPSPLSHQAQPQQHPQHQQSYHPYPAEQQYQQTLPAAPAPQTEQPIEQRTPNPHVTPFPQSVQTQGYSEAQQVAPGSGSPRQSSPKGPRALPQVPGPTI